MRLDFTQVWADWHPEESIVESVFWQDVIRWLEEPPPKSWLCSAHCCGSRDLNYWKANQEKLRRKIQLEQEDILRFAFHNNISLLYPLPHRKAHPLNIVFLTLESPRQVFHQEIF